MFRRNAVRGTVGLVVLMMLAGGSRTAPQANGQATTAATPAAELTFGPGSFNLQPTMGLADLSGYQSTLKIDFNGNEDGQPNFWTETMAILSRGKPSARALTATFKGKAPAAAYVAPWSAAINGMFYRRAGDGACIGRVIETQTDPNAPPLVWEPADFLPGVVGAEDAGAKQVNGIAAKGYKFDERALGAAGQVKATGEVWVAEKGGYVVKYSLTLKGGAEYFGEGSEGTLTWTYDVTKAGQPAAIAVPKDCSEGIIDGPVMQDAQKVQRAPGTTQYMTKSPITQIADFYKQELPAAGWKMEGKPDISKKAGLLSFKQGDSHLTVIITVGNEVTRVRLVLETSRKG
jgi:hypothetical protein